MAAIGLNFVVAGSVGKYVRTVKATYCLTKKVGLGVPEHWVEHFVLGVCHRKEWWPWKLPWWNGGIGHQST